MSELFRLLKEIQKNSDLAANVLEYTVGDEDKVKGQIKLIDQIIKGFDAETGNINNYPGMQKAWNQFKADWLRAADRVENRPLLVKVNVEEHANLTGQIMAMVQIILDNSAIALDPEPVSYYLSQAILVQTPVLVDEIRKTRGFGLDLLAASTAAAGESSGQEDRFHIIESASQSHRLLAEIKDNLNKSGHSNAPLKERLKARVDTASKHVEDVLKLTQNELVAVNKPNYSALNYRIQLSETIESIFALSDLGFKELDEIYNKQLGDARVNLFVTSAIVSIMFVLGFLTTFYITASISHQVNNLLDVVNKLAAGDNKVRTGMETLDEIGVLGRQFDIMVDQREAVSAAIKKENEMLNNSIIDLLQAVAKLSRRDLTVKVPVTEDITGPVADALNLLTQETATVLNRVVQVAEDVSRVSRQIKNQSDSIINVATEEKQQVEQAADELSAASEVMLDIAKLAVFCNEAAEKAIKNTDKAEQTVLNTVQGITTLRDTIRETEKRIKRLGERSQEIGSVVNIINNIAERTHTLAINASMHAASAGEAGRGFAVVANEVQKLAENARLATAQITTLVNNIQVETAETVNTMNEAISQVVHGSSLALQAGNEMRETRDTTAELVQLVQRIAENSKTQSETTLRLRDSAKEIQKGTEHTYEELQLQGQQTDRLVNFSDSLVDSVSVFTLPRVEAATA